MRPTGTAAVRRGGPQRADREPYLVAAELEPPAVPVGRIDRLGPRLLELVPNLGVLAQPGDVALALQEPRYLGRGDMREELAGARDRHALPRQVQLEGRATAEHLDLGAGPRVDLLEWRVHQLLEQLVIDV